MKKITQTALILAATLFTSLNMGLSAGAISKIESNDVFKSPNYSQATTAGRFVFLAGQEALDVSGKMVGSTVEEQTTQVIKNVENILAARGLTLKDVVRVQVYLKDFNDFAAMNTAYQKKFVYDIKPARNTYAVHDLPYGAVVKMEVTAYIPDELVQ